MHFHGSVNFHAHVKNRINPFITVFYFIFQKHTLLIKSSQECIQQINKHPTILKIFVANIKYSIACEHPWPIIGKANIKNIQSLCGNNKNQMSSIYTQWDSKNDKNELALHLWPWETLTRILLWILDHKLHMI